MNRQMPSWGALVATAPTSAAVLVGLEAGLTLSIYLRPWTLGWLVDASVAGHPRAGLAVPGWALVLGLLWLLRHQVAACKEEHLAKVAALLGGRLRCAVAGRLHLVPLSELDRQGAGLLAARLELDIATLMVAGVRAPLDLAATALRLLIGATCVALLCPDLLLCLGAMVPLVLGAVLVMRRRALPALQARAAATATLAAECQEAIAACSTVRQAGAVEEVLQRVAARQRDVDHAHLRLAMATSWLQPLLLVLLHAGLGAVLICGGSAVVRGTMGFGALTSCLFLVFLVLGPLQEAATLWEQQLGAAAARRRLAAFLRTQGGDGATVPAAAPDDAVAVICQDATLVHPAGGAVVGPVSLRVAVGERLLIHGPSGAGKSTLVELLSGLRAPTSGSVRHGRHGLRVGPQAATRGGTLTVVQGDALFTGTIASNLRLALPVVLDEVAADARLRACAQRLGCHDAVNALPAGYATPVGSERGALPAALHQRLLVVRALLGEPRLLILDEAASALDGEAACRLYQAVGEVVPTLVVVDHRVAMAEMATRVHTVDCARRALIPPPPGTRSASSPRAG